MRTSRGPTVRRSIVVRTSGSVAETAAMALTVEMTASRLAVVGDSSKPQPYARRESLSKQVPPVHLSGPCPRPCRGRAGRIGWVELPAYVEAVVFDNDGLLVDTEVCWSRAETKIFAEHGHGF